MKRILILTVAVALLFFASSAFAQYSGPVTMTYNGNNYDTGSWNGDVTGFYGGTIDGASVGGSASNPGMLCDDFRTALQTPWSAYKINVETLLANWSTYGSQTKFFGLGENAYIEMAILVQAAFAGHSALSLLSGVSGTTAADVSQALWCITGGPSCNSSGMSAAGYALWQKVISLVAGGTYNLSSFAGLSLYVPTPLSASQEMWAVPEGGTALLYLLLAGVSCFGAMFFRSRNQVSRPGMA
jgi:hypothetical protein